MAGAQANVRNIITIDGVDNASDAVNKAKKALGLLGDQATKTGKGMETLAAQPGIDAAKIQSTTQRAGGAFSALAGALGPAATNIAEVGRSATALGGVAGVLPGPIGLMASAIIGAGAAAYMLAKNANESAAKLRLLATPQARQLGKDLGFSADETAKLSKALTDLGEGAAAPTAAMLAKVRENAKAMGQEPAENVAKFMAAWKEGPAAVKAVQTEIGNLNIVLESLPKVARLLGLDPKSLGIEDTKSNVDQLKASLLEVSRNRENAHSLEQSIATKYAEMSDATLDRGIALRAEIGVLEEQRQKLADQADLEERNAKFKAKKVDAERDFGDVTKATGAIAAGVEADAALHGNRRAALGIRIAGIQKQQEVLEAAIAKQQALVTAGTGKEAQDRLDALKLQQKQLEVQAFTTVDADKAERKAKAQAAAQEAQSNRQAITDAKLRTLKAEADRDGLQTERERLAILDAEQAKEVEATKGTKNHKVRAEQLKAIDADYVTKRATLQRQLAEDSNKTDDEVYKNTADSMAKTTERVRQANDAMVATAKVRSASIADALRAQGREEDAAETERRQAHADYTAALNAIDQDRVDALKDKIVPGSTDALAIESLAEQKRLQAKIALDEVERKIDKDREDRNRQARADAGDTLEGPANALKALAALGPQFARAGGLGGGLSAAVKGFKDLDRAMAQSKDKAQAVAGAVGGAVEGISASMIEAEKTRTLAQLDNEERRRLSTATTEQQRAAITAEFEDKKAQAVEDAERRKAAIMALVEAAQAIASYPNVPAMIAHGAAAVMFGAIAGGVAGSAPSARASTPGAGGSGGFNATSGPSAGGSSGSGKGLTVINNYNQPLVTKQDIGKSVSGSLRSLKGTGTDGTRGA